MNEKFRIRHSCTPQCDHSWERPVRNYTGKPWLVHFPVGHKHAWNATSGWTTDGRSFDTFEEARQYAAFRVNDLAAKRIQIKAYAASL